MSTTTPEKARTVVTGIGLCAPNGLGPTAYWKNTLRGQSGIGPITRFDTSKYWSKIAGEVPGFEPAEHLQGRLPPQTDHMTRLALVATDWALWGAGLRSTDVPEYDMAVVTAATAGSVVDFKARFRLSELLHDQARELPAAEVLRPVCDLMEKDETAKDTCGRAYRTPESVISRMHYFFACHFHEQGDSAQERKHLDSAIASDPTDADALIAMYRVQQADEAWKQKTRRAIEETTDFAALAADDPVPVETDPGKVRQILLNLLSNAAKFTDDGHVDLILRPGRARVYLSIEDTGIGIDRADQERIFEPFTQVERSATRTRGGTGLGLSVSRHLARMLEGELTVRSELGRGSRFELALPRRPANAHVGRSGQDAAQVA